MGRVKNQHYVPRVYLKRFTHDGKKLFVYDKVEGRVFESSIGNVASETGFYDLSPAAFKDGTAPPAQVVEDFLSRVESLYDQVLNGLVVRISRESAVQRHKNDLAYFMAVQMLRTREARITIQLILNKTVQHLADELVRKNYPDMTHLTPRVEFTRDAVAALHAVLLLGPDEPFAGLREVRDALAAHIWLVGYSESGRPLYTSDHPVVREREVHGEACHHRGIDAPGIEIAFPVTPNIIIIILERREFSRYEAKDLTTVALTEAQVVRFNKMQVAQSTRHVFCPDADFEVAERVCRERPEVCSPDRERVEVLPLAGDDFEVTVH